jgi:hypothetical protein
VIAAIVLLFLKVFGIEPSAEELLAFETEYWSRVHHVFFEIGSQIDEDGFASTFALGYEALLDPGGTGAAFEILVETLPIGDEPEFLLAVGAGHYVHPKIKIGVAAGPVLRPDRDVEVRGRIEMAGRFQVFAITISPFARFSATSDQTYDFGFGGRFEY